MNTALRWCYYRIWECQVRAVLDMLKYINLHVRYRYLEALTLLGECLSIAEACQRQYWNGQQHSEKSAYLNLSAPEQVLSQTNRSTHFGRSGRHKYVALGAHRVCPLQEARVKAGVAGAVPGLSGRNRQLGHGIGICSGELKRISSIGFQESFMSRFELRLDRSW